MLSGSIFIPIFVVISFLLVSTVTYSQSAKQWMKVGDQSYADKDYYGASIYYKKALKEAPENIHLLYKYAESLRQFNNYDQAAYAYAAVVAEDEKIDYPESRFWLASMQKSNGDYSKAKSNFGKFASTYADQSSYLYQKAVQEVKSCAFAIELMKKDTLPVKISHPEDSLNTPDSEFSPLQVNDSTLLFSSLRAEKLKDGNAIEDSAYFVRIYQAKKDSEEWVMKEQLDTIINDPDMHNANGSFSLDKQRFYFTRCDENFLCKIYISRLHNNQWGLPMRLDSTINLPGYTSTQPMVANVDDKELLFFVSNRTGGQGNLDIWWSIVTGNGQTYQSPVNAGPTINSIDDEITPFYHTDSNLLYFSSNWHFGLGGFDIFKSYGGLEPDSIKNLGPPINTCTNDFYYTVNPNGREGFFSSNRQGSISLKGATCCNDIYAYEFKEPEKEEEPVDTLIAEVPDTVESISRLEREFSPVTVYFHNDEPDPRTWDTTTSINYREHYKKYRKMLNEYKKEYTTGLERENVVEAHEAITEFFDGPVKTGIEELSDLANLVVEELTKGKQVELTVQGYASPLHKSDYNVHLSLRRIASVINYFKAYNSGQLLPYLDGTAENGAKLSFVKLPFGEEQAAPDVSDNLHDLQKSVYSIRAAKERKVKVLSAKVTGEKPRKPEISFSATTHDFGEISATEKVSHQFTFTNTGATDLRIKEIEVACGCTAADWPREEIPPGGSGTIKLIFDPSGKRGRQVKTATVHSNAGEVVLTLNGVIK